MFFKNLVIYRIRDVFDFSFPTVAEALSRFVLQKCGPNDVETRGFILPRPGDQFVYALGQQALIAFGTDQKILPAAVINQTAKERAAEIAEQQGHAVGRKQLRELKERVTEELLPKALTRGRSTFAWIDATNGLLIVDASSIGKAEEVVELLHKAGAGLALKSLQTSRPPSAAMTDWVASGEAPAGFTIDQDLVLESPDSGQATVKYVRHDLAGKEIQDHIAAGKVATRLALTWEDRISFVLTEDLQIKRLTFLDILKEEAESQVGQSSGEADELFDINFTLMTGELQRLINSLIHALGGIAAV